MKGIGQVMDMACQGQMLSVNCLALSLWNESDSSISMTISSILNETLPLHGRQSLVHVLPL